MTIKHLVISGGGPILLQVLGAIQELEKNKYLNMSDIESIYGTSAGAAIGVMLSLKFDWETINDYLIKRPWQDVFPIRVQTIVDAYSKRGLFDSKTIELCFKPLFNARDIPMDINLVDFYHLTNIEQHFFTFEINEYTLEDVSYKTHPHLSLMNAIQMTCALPVFIAPLCMDGKCFMDGGAACNYPLTYCLQNVTDPDEVLGFKNKYGNRKMTCNEDSTLFDYVLFFLFKAVFSINNNYVQPTIKNELVCDASYLSFELLNATLSNMDNRRDLFERGKQSAIQFMSNNTGV